MCLTSGHQSQRSRTALVTMKAGVLPYSGSRERCLMPASEPWSSVRCLLQVPASVPCSSRELLTSWCSTDGCDVHALMARHVHCAGWSSQTMAASSS